MLFILCLCLKGEVEGCSVLLMCQEEGDLVQKMEKKKTSQKEWQSKGKCWKDRLVNNYVQKYYHCGFLTESSEKKGGTTLNVLNKHYSCCQSAEDIGKWKISYQMFK